MLYNLKNWHLGVPFSGTNGIPHIVVYVNGILHAKGKNGPMGGLKENDLDLRVLYTYIIGKITSKIGSWGYNFLGQVVYYILLYV